MFFVERENIWMKIVDERRKRVGNSPLTAYCVKSYRKVISIMPQRSMEPRYNGQHYAPAQPMIAESIRVPLQPIWHNDENRVFPNGIKRHPENRGFIPYKRVPTFESLRPEFREEPREVEKLKWPGIQEVMESYQRYAKGKNLSLFSYRTVSVISVLDSTVETMHLRHRCTMLSEQIRCKQIEADSLERKVRELRSLRIFHEQERQQIEQNLNNLKRLIAAFIR